MNMKQGPLIVIVILGMILITMGYISVITTGQTNGDHMDDEHMDEGDMMNWWGIPFMGFWMIGIWLVFVIIAVLVYKDAEKRGMSGILWAVLVILPWIGILFLIIYLLVREDTKRQMPVQKSPGAILDERYARGEITREEYQLKKLEIERDRRAYEP